MCYCLLYSAEETAAGQRGSRVCNEARRSSPSSVGNRLSSGKYRQEGRGASEGADISRMSNAAKEDKRVGVRHEAQRPVQVLWSPGWRHQAATTEKRPGVVVKR